MNTHNNYTQRNQIDITSAALLVDWSISTWTGRRTDKKATAELLHQNGARKGVASVNKSIMGNFDELSALTSAKTRFDSALKGATMPWTDNGLRLLPVAQHQEFEHMITGLQQEWEDLLNKFRSAYAFKIGQAQLELGKLFDPDIYPPVDHVISKFKFTYHYMPLANASDFRVQIGHEQAAQIRDQYAAMYDTQLQAAMGDVWQRVHTALTHLIDKLNACDENEKTRLHNSTVETIHSMARLLDACNLTNDPQMTQAANAIRDMMLGVNKDALKLSETLRGDTRKKAESIAKTINNLGLGW